MAKLKAGEYTVQHAQHLGHKVEVVLVSGDSSHLVELSQAEVADHFPAPGEAAAVNKDGTVTFHPGATLKQSKAFTIEQ